MTADPPLALLDRDMTGASDEQLLKVVSLIDTLDRRGAVDQLLEPVRQRLAQLRPARPVTLGRVLVLPFEDLLVDEAEAWRGRRCFARRHLARLVEMVAADLPARARRELRARAEGRSMMAGEVVREIGTALWPAAAAASERRLASGEVDPAMRDQLAAVVPLLALGDELVAAIWQLPPKPMGRLARPMQERMLAAVRSAALLGEEALQSVLELMLVRASSPMIVLEPLHGADLGIPARARDAALARLVERRIADMRETASRLAQASDRVRPSAATLLRLVGDLDTLEGKWPVSPREKATLREIRGATAAYVGAGIDQAIQDEILAKLGTLAQPQGLPDESVERLEETARHTRRLGIAGAKLGLATSADALLDRFLPTFQAAIRARAADSGSRAGLLDQVRVVEILFGPDTAIRLYGEARGRLAAG